MAGPRDDIELMQHFDGELADPRDDVELSAEDRAKLEALGQVRESVRGALELAADDVDDRLDAMWGAIERSISANGAAPRDARIDSGSPVAAPRAADPDGGLFTRFGRWLDEYRGHVLTGAIAAGAAAVLVIALRSPDTVTRTEYVQVPAKPDPGQGPAKGPNPAETSFAKSEPAVVESLDVVDGSGTILTIPGEEGENPTTVIWVTSDDLEGPI